MLRYAFALLLVLLTATGIHAQVPEIGWEQAEARYDKCLDDSLQHSAGALPSPTPDNLLDRAEFVCRDQLRLYATLFYQPANDAELKLKIKQAQEKKERGLLDNHPVMTEFVELMPRAYIRLKLILDNCRPIDRKKVQTYMKQTWPFDPHIPSSKRGYVEQLLHKMRDSELGMQRKELKEKGPAAWCAGLKQLFESVGATDIFQF